ncbi:MAG: prepilin peptidase [Clostridia bacterium]
MENIILYIILFCMGTVFGSFFTLAVYRLPLHQDITHERSYCPKCNHKLSFWDMIPIISYIALGGKCRYCKEKIRIRYLLLEVMSGLVFALFGMSIQVSLFHMATDRIIYVIAGLLYIAGLIIIAGIDKEKRQIHKGVMIYETIIITLYMIYLCILEEATIYRYVIYVFAILILQVMDTYYFKKYLKNSYVVNILILICLMAAFQGKITFMITAVGTLLAIAIEQLIEKIRQASIKYKKVDQKETKKIPIGFYLCTMQIVAMLILNFLACRWF